MSESLPAEVRPVPKKPLNSPGGETVLLMSIGGVGLLAAIVLLVIAQNVGGNVFEDFTVEDLAQKISLTVLGVGVGIVGLSAFIMVAAITAIRSALLNGE